MKDRKRFLTLMAAAMCTLVGAAAGISESTAATHSHTAHSAASGEWPGRPPGGMPGPGGPGRDAVHSVGVVLNKAGTAFISETTDSGTVKEVDSAGATITITEGTKSVTYGTPKIAIPSGATVMLDGKTSTLSALTSGDHVSVSSSSEGTTVFAVDSAFLPGAGWHGGPTGGPPPGAPGGPE